MPEVLCTLRVSEIRWDTKTQTTFPCDRAEPSLGVVLKSGGTAPGDLCVRGARHPRVARAAVPIAIERDSPLCGTARAPEPESKPGTGYASRGRNRWPGASVIHDLAYGTA